ncbi:hypothetical protein BYT27DRAFT_7303358, partial [Phlegmacium glaucopus]
YLPWDKVVQNRFEPVQNWFSDFWPIQNQNQNQNQMAGGEPEPEPNQNRGSVQLVLVLWTGSEPNFGIPTAHPQAMNLCLRHSSAPLRRPTAQIQGLLGAPPPGLLAASQQTNGHKLSCVLGTIKRSISALGVAMPEPK